MDYEKKYKEANDKVAARFGTNVAKEIFTDLYESEDEKIRKSLIHLVHLYGGEFGMIDANTSVEKAIAWLEKQGESYTKRDVDNAYIEGMAFAKDELEKQGKQKPYWSEEDEKRLKSCLNILQAKGLMGVTDTINSNWLKSLKERVQPQPKQEWSEEDKKHIIDIMDYLDDYYSFAKDEYKDVADGVLNEIRWLQSI